MRRRIHTALLALPLAAALLLPTAADAGVYKVYSCKTPSGRIAPTDGWRFYQDGGAFSAPANGCAAGGALDAQLNGDFPQPAGNLIGFGYGVHPAGTELAGFRMWRHFSTTASAEQNATPVAYLSWPSVRFSPDARGECVAGRGCTGFGSTNLSALEPDDLVTYDDLPSETYNFWVLAGCAGSETCSDRNSPTPMARVAVKALEAHIRDTAAPAVSNVQSTISTTDVNSGRHAVSFAATDVGSGVYRSIVEWRKDSAGDWQRLSAQTVDVNDQRCVDVDTRNRDEHEFFYQQPCPTDTGGGVDVDTTMLPNGAHQLRVLVEDAAGNRTGALGPIAFKVSNGATTGAAGPGILGTPNNGSGATNQVRIVVTKQSRRRAKRLRFGQRYRLVATIRNETGEPVRGARVEVLQRVKLAGAAYRVARKPITTGRRGQVRWTVPAGTSRRLRLGYKANLLNGDFQSITDVPLEVSAATTLRRNRSSYRNGQTIRFRGKVRSKPIPKGGVLIDLQAYKRGTGWVTFATKRTGRVGRWRIGYKLTSTSATVRYRFRARIRQDSGYPYSAGRTKPMSVLVRP